MRSASNHSGSQDIIGREEFIAQLWHILEERSFILSAERRFGKTYIIQEMTAHPPNGVLTFYQDLESLHTAEDFAQSVCTKVLTGQPLSKRILQGAADRLSRLQGGKMGFKFPALGPHLPEMSVDLPKLADLPWQVKLTAGITGLMENKQGPAVFFWDEMPWMIEHIIKRQGMETAQELLGLLRVLRQEPDLQAKLRMVYTGSIGFHHVLAEVVAAPLVNDMKHIFLLPLQDDYAQQFALRRLAYEGAKADDLTEIAREIAEAADKVPFYIQNLTQSLSVSGQSLRKGDAEKFLAKMLRQSPEDWELPHFDTRLDTYYTSAQARIARDLLDILAVKEEVADFAELRNLLNSKQKIKNADEVRHILDLLRQDHYLWPDPYCFQMPLIRRFWRVRRGL